MNGSLKIQWVLAFVVGGLCFAIPLRADQTLEPSDPIAAVDGNPIYMGELNLILTERWNVRDLDGVGSEVRQATATLLIRRHLAMKSLKKQGGQALQAIIQRQVDAFASEAKRRGSSLAEQAAVRMADKNSLVADLAWRAAWSRYLKSRLSDANLRRYFDSHPSRYAGSRWEVSQIFVKMESADQVSVDETAQRMSELADQIRASDSIADSFAEAAREHSESGSSVDGGLIGWVENDGDLPGTVMEVVRHTKSGDVSGPVRSPLGMHLIYVHRHEVGQQRFDDLADHSQLRRDAADALFDTLVAQQRDAKITWFVRSLRPPADVKIIP